MCLVSAPVERIRFTKQAALNLSLIVKKTRKQVFLEQMDQVVPWAALEELIAPYYPEGRKGRPPFSLLTMLRIHFMQQWFNLSDPAMEEGFFDTPVYREFAQLEEFARLPDESTILRFRHRLEKHKLAEQILATVNDILIERGLLLNEADALLDQAEKLKASIRAKVEHPFRVIKRQFGFVKVRYREWKKNTAQIVTLFALSNLWMVRSKLMGVRA